MPPECPKQGLVFKALNPKLLNPKKNKGRLRVLDDRVELGGLQFCLHLRSVRSDMHAMSQSRRMAWV